MNPIHIIGMGQGKSDLTETHIQIIHKADLLVGGRRHLSLFSAHKGETLVISGPMDLLVDRIKTAMAHQNIVVLASGDPLFYGIGATLVRAIDKKFLKIHANISSIAAGFAAIGEPWHDARIISLHGKIGQDFVFPSLRGESKAAFLTDAQRDPGFIAAQLIQAELFGFTTWVLENLGDPDLEKITWFETYDQILDQTFAHPNIVILLKEGAPSVPPETHLGMTDESFRHAKGLITKSEIRSISLSKLKLVRKDHTLWDIGSGSGSISIEASGQIPWGQVFAIEKNQARLGDISHNIHRYHRTNIQVLNLDFPDGGERLKTPDRIFIGGGGSNLEQILGYCCDRIKPLGILVVNTVLVQNLAIALQVLTEKGFTPEVVHVQVSRSKPMPYGDRLEPLNPVWIISGRKPFNKAEST